MTSANRSAPELPVLRLGLAGFTREEEAQLCVELAGRATDKQMAWQVATLGNAYAWCVNGSRLRRMPDGTWRIVPAHRSDAPVRVNPDAIDWPVAFSLPAGPPGFDPAYAFDLDSPASMQGMLQQIEGWLRPVMLQFSLAAHLIHQNVDLSAGVYHVTVSGKLYAVVSRRHGIAVWPLADPVQLKDAVWHRRPEGADAVPGTFVCTGLAEAMWQYASRTTRDCLPAHYRRKRLYLRRPPPLPMRLLSDRCLLLVRELSRGPGTLRELVARTGTPAVELARHVAALHIVGSVTANPKRLAAGAADAGWNSSLPAGQGDSDINEAEITVRLTRAADGGSEPTNIAARAAMPAPGTEGVHG